MNIKNIEKDNFYYFKLITIYFAPAVVLNFFGFRLSDFHKFVV
jgi:hypothetical protein